MNWIVIGRPLIGAGIGYITNWIAVKMLFRPLKPIKVGKFKLPFTPGIIPKNKERLAKAIGNTINDNLLTEETLKASLLSDKTKNNIRKNIKIMLNNLSSNNETIEKLLLRVINNNLYNKLTENIITDLTESILETIKSSNVSKLISKEIENAANEKLKGSMLGLFGANAIVSKISDETSKKIDEYIENNGNELISGMITVEINKIVDTPASSLIKKLQKNEIDIVSILMDLYEKIIISKISDILKTIDISNIIAEKINSMDVLELEKLILEVMKNELNALINLGAIIGFILGLLNLLF